MAQTHDSAFPVVAADRLGALQPLYAAAFPDEDLLPLVTALLTGYAEEILSLGAWSDDRLVGHIVFTRVGIGDASRKAALLGPMCVDPVMQGQGLGTRLIAGGLERLREQAVEQVMVLGDPAFYGRSGFQADASVIPPCPLPAQWAAAWQMIRLVDGDPLVGKMKAPDPWMDPALWQE